MDHAAQRQQVARIFAHHAGGEVLLRLAGTGDAFPAVITSDKPKSTQLTHGSGVQFYELVIIAREVFAGKDLPRKSQHFTGPTGQVFRIAEDRSVTSDPKLVFACTSAK